MKRKSKKCTKCGKRKLLLEFPISKQVKEGRIARCKLCINEYIKSWKRANPEKTRDTSKRAREKNGESILASSRKYRMNNREELRYKGKIYRLENKETVSASQKKYLSENPDIAIAHRMIQSAVRSGKKENPKKCSRCGRRGNTREIQAHHPDYSKPMHVVWICIRCHNDIPKRGKRNRSAIS